MLNSFKEIIKNHVSKNNYKKLRNIYIKLKNIFYFGNKYRCPCCNKNFRKFQNFYYKTNEFNHDFFYKSYKNTICPVCYSFPRHRIICEYLKSNLNLIKNKKILIFAPEHCITSFLDTYNIKYLTADLYHEADYKIDITNINFPNESFEVIVCNHVLEHVSNYKNALKELNRILTKNGILILTTPLNPNSNKTMENNCKNDLLRKQKFGQIDHLRLFGLDIIKTLEKYNFQVDDINGNTFDKKIYPISGPSKYDYNHVFICTKK